MKKKEANAFEEQLLKQKMDELHKKLHQVVELSQEDLPSVQEKPKVQTCSDLGVLCPAVGIVGSLGPVLELILASNFPKFKIV